MANAKYDFTGQKFGRLTALRREGSHWACLCTCGAEKLVSTSDLNLGKVQSCGCYRKEAAAALNKLEDVIGMRFGRLVAVRETVQDGQFRKFECLCDCGNLATVRLNGLRGGTTRSCGCLMLETSAQNNRTHGMSGTRTHRIWKAMLTRVRNPNATTAHNYIDRGITVCERWLKFENFLEDMGEAPENLSIDREDNDGDYCKENCRWATQTEQARNRDRAGEKKNGVNLHKSGKWRVLLPFNGVNKHIGLFVNYEDAVAARKAAELKYWS